MTSPDANNARGEPRMPQGAILTADQLRMLRKAVAVMSVMLVVGFLTVIGRIGYLMMRSGDAKSAAPANASLTAVSAPAVALLQPDVRLALPAGEQVKSTTLAGHYLVVHHGGASGDTISIVDLTTGKVASRVKLETAPR